MCDSGSGGKEGFQPRASLAASRHGNVERGTQSGSWILACYPAHSEWPNLAWLRMWASG